MFVGLLLVISGGFGDVLQTWVLLWLQALGFGIGEWDLWEIPIGAGHRSFRMRCPASTGLYKAFLPRF